MRSVAILPLTLVLTSCGGGDIAPATSGQTVIPTGSSIPPEQINVGLVIASNPTVSMVETNQVAYQMVVKSTSSAAITMGISGGADQALFEMNENGVLSFRTPPTFAAPIDSNRDNVYEVTIYASDGRTAYQSVRITVTPAATSCA